MALTPVETSPRFRKAYRKKPKDMREAVDRTVVQLRKDPAHPGLRSSKVQGKPGVWESRIGGGTRLTWNWEDDTIVLRNHCHHDILKKP